MEDDQPSGSTDQGGDTDLIINWESALDLLGGDRAFLRTMLDTSVEEIQGLLPQLEESLSAKDRELARRLAHTIKGAARAVAAERTMRAAQAVEHEAVNEQFARAAELMTPLRGFISEFANEVTASAKQDSSQ